MSRSLAPSDRASTSRTHKRIVICCDGTWLDSDGGLQNGAIPVPSNVTRISQAIKSRSSDNIPQVVYYQAGIGSMGNVIDRVVGGTTGQGLSEHIRAGYSFIANNYHTGDELFLFGFSRGAFTARSIAGLIGDLGLLTKSGLPYLAEIFKDYQHRWEPHYRPANPNVPFPNRPSTKDPAYAEELERRFLTRLGIRIKVIGVWDTVGSLGIPRVSWLGSAVLNTKSTKELFFYDTSLSDCIENAFQALALDENRASFPPAVWEKPRGNNTNLRQVWFPGVHTNIGGGYNDQGQANISLAWMISQVEPYLEFDPDYILEENEKTRNYYVRTGQEPRPWSFGEIYRSLTGIFFLGGTSPRTPGRFRRTNPNTGRPTSRLLRQTNEYIHPSARSRIILHGPGMQDHGTYECKALQPYKLTVERAEFNANDLIQIWVLRSRRKNGISLPESPLWETEKRLLRTDPELYDFVMQRPKGPSRRSP